MIPRWLQRLLRRHRPVGHPLSGVSPPQPGAMPNEALLDGAIHRRSVHLADVPIDQLRRESRQLTFESGLVVDEEVDAFALTGDGSVTDSLEGFARCDLCAAEASAVFLNRQCSAQKAHLMGLCRVERLSQSDHSGLRVCPRHTRRVTTPQGEMTLTVHEAEQMAADQLIQRPVQLLFRLIFD